jgi:hypothetical protein
MTSVNGAAVRLVAVAFAMLLRAGGRAQQRVCYNRSAQESPPLIFRSTRDCQ